MAKHFQKGDRVFAKVRGYPPWPARIEKIECNNSGRNKFVVMFYGTYETSICKLNDLFHYNENKEVFGKPMKRKGFNEALIEVEKNAPLPNLTPKKDEKIKCSYQISDNIESVNESVGRKKTNSKRKRNSSIESPVNTPTTQNNPNEMPPQKRFKVSDNDNLSDLTKTEIISRSGRRIKLKKFSDDILYDSTNSNFSSAIPTNSVYIQDTKIHKNYKTTLSAHSTLRKKNSIKSHMESEACNSKDSFNNNCNNTNTNTSGEHEPVQKVIEMDRLTWFRNELLLLQLEDNIRSYLTVNSANTEKAIEALQQLKALSLHPLMLKKYPRIVQTINRLRRYVGNVETKKISEEEQLEFCEEAKSIRSEAECVFKIFKSLFTVPEGSKFLKVFQEQVSEFQKLTLSLSHEEMCALTKDPMHEHAEFSVETNEENSQREVTV